MCTYVPIFSKKMFETFAVLFVTNDFTEENEHLNVFTFLVKELKEINGKVEMVSFINENVKVLTHELSFLSRQYDILLVIGNIRNNVIFKALGAICQEELVKNGYESGLCSDSWLPSVAKCLSIENVTNPIVYLQRIFILDKDSVEISYTRLLKQHLQQYCNQHTIKKSFNIYTENVTLDELELIKNVVAVSLKKEKTHTTLTIEGTEFDCCIDCIIFLNNKYGKKIEEICDSYFTLRNIFENQEEHIHQAINNIVNCFETYGLDNVFLSFNGGKDCTVLLHLIYVVLKIKYPEYKKKIICMYVRNGEVFPEQDKFVYQCQLFYNLDLTSYSLDMKQALKKVLKFQPNLKACLMGTRHTDPYSANLSFFQPTDPSWPKIMRVSPLLRWHYTDIWDYLLFNKVPYCELYDQGYTSLGNATNTIKNASLYFFDVKLGKHVYLPAYKMLNEAEERTGRNIQR